MTNKKWIVCVSSLICVSVTSLWAAQQPSSGPIGAPGIPHRWAPALKQAIGSAYEQTGAASPVWFTVAQGILTEVFYPSVDQAQVGDLQFLITDGQSFFSEQKRDTVSTVKYLNEGMTVQITGNERSGRYSFEQKIVADPAAPVVRIHTVLKKLQPGLRLFVLFKPAINNTGSHNLGYTTPEGLFATKMGSSRQTTVGKFNSTRDIRPVTVALIPSKGFSATSAGYVGFSDGWQDLSRNFRITQPWQEAGPGNIAMIGEIRMNGDFDFAFDIALSFGESRSEAETYAQTSLTKSFNQVRSAYEAGWDGYLQDLQNSPLMKGKRFLNGSAFARRSAQIIKMHEDKRRRGAVAASLSKPAIPDSESALDGTGGYHLIWPRDLYHAAMGLLAAGDTRTPIDILRYFVQTQQYDGSWAQNFWVDGTPYWRGLQMDEVSFPILLAAQLKKRNIHQLTSEELDMVRRATMFIISHGPTTPQDRWEEIGGYVPSTLAAEIAALRMASSLTGDHTANTVANQWQTLLESWTLVQNGPHGKSYYIRTSPNGNPNDPEPIDIANGGGKAFASEIVDGGFLELVRLKIRAADDPRIVSTMKVYESPDLGVASGDSSSIGMTYRRYNRDAYGESRIGGFWPLLAGERGHYAVAARDMERARAQLFILERSALGSDLLPEQTVTAPSSDALSNTPVGSGVACPLVWAHAEDILLHRSIEEGTIFDAPLSD